MQLADLFRLMHRKPALKFLYVLVQFAVFSLTFARFSPGWALVFLASTLILHVWLADRWTSVLRQDAQQNRHPNVKSSAERLVTGQRSGKQRDKYV